MNTVKIGNEFEAYCLEIIHKAIADLQLGASATYLRPIAKKGYYSDKRKSEIIFDLAIEFWPPGAKRFMMVYLVECKYYSGSVPVNDVEEFHSKINQVAGVNVKGIFITNKGFQEGAYQFAVSTGMMLILASSNNNYEIILHRRNLLKNKLSNLSSVKTEDEEVQRVQNILNRKIRSAFGPTNEVELPDPSTEIEKLSKREIETIAEAELEKINPNILAQAHSLSYEGLEKYITTSYKIQILPLELKSKLLGGFSSAGNVIWIHPSIIRSKRGLFVLAHEFGHAILHNNLVIDQEQYDKFPDPEMNFRTGKVQLTNSKHWIEWQANCFASALLLPQRNLIARLNKFQLDEGWRRSHIYVDDQPVNLKAFHLLIDKLSTYFNVTKTSVIYKLKDINMLVFDSRMKHISEVLRDSGDLYF